MRRPRPFADRGEAGRVLGVALGTYARRDDVLVLGLPRGGVPVAAEVAAALGAPLDVLVVRKLGVPGHPELAMGAIAFDGVRVLNPGVVSSLGITDVDVDEVVARERAELDRRRRTYRGDRPPLDVGAKVVIVVDDGLATGATMRAAVAAVRAGRPTLVVVAVPVGARTTCEELVGLADDVVCVRSPANFEAVGQWYVDFSAPSDDEVRRLLGNPSARRTRMAHEVEGVVAGAAGEAVALRTLLVPDPGPGEVLVRVQACGVCHTDLHYREGAINDDFPFLLGHEAAGVVEAAGDGVAGVTPGDFVVLAWRAPCGSCRSCLRGRPWYCFDSRNASQKMTLEDGTPLTPALGIGAFTPLTLVAAGQAVKVPAARPEAAGLIGCGVMAGIGAALHTGAVQRGDTVAVFGCGGVGNAAIAASVLAGARQVIAVDIDERKLAVATEFGATATVRATHVDPVQAVKDLTGGFGVDVAIEAVGLPETMLQAFYARDLAGTLVQVGVPAPHMTVELPMIEFFGRGGALKPSWYGDCLPTRDFPVLIDAYLAGRLDLDRFVSETIGIDQVEEAFARMQRGEVLRSVVVF